MPGDAEQLRRLRAISERLARLPQAEWIRQGGRVLWRDGDDWTEAANCLSEWVAEFLVSARADIRWLLQLLGEVPRLPSEYADRSARRVTVGRKRRIMAEAPRRCECGDVLELFCCRCGQALCGRHVAWVAFADNPPAPRCYGGVGCSK